MVNRNNSFRPMLPDNYLENGYFKPSSDNSKMIKKELLDKQAKQISKAIGGRKGINKNQLRKFYDYCVNLERKLNMCGDYKYIEPDIQKLKYFAADAKSKNNIPQIFYNFIEKNVDSINNQDDYVKGFLVHFEAVVGYFSYFNPRN